jgi:hypothetical protein
MRAQGRWESRRVVLVTDASSNRVQAQDSLLDQLDRVWALAIQHGEYDAADQIKHLSIAAREREQAHAIPNSAAENPLPAWCQESPPRRTFDEDAVQENLRDATRNRVPPHLVQHAHEVRPRHALVVALPDVLELLRERAT